MLLTIVLSVNTACGQQTKIKNKSIPKTIRTANNETIVGAERTKLYIDQIKDKNIAVVANPSSLILNTHLVDSLLAMGINVKTVMSPEHGFRGDAGAGEHIKSGVDSKTGLPIISLYGSHKKPTKEDLKDIDILIFDLQDVGARFYTYLSTLNLCMEACAENNVQLIVFDRPNPNGSYVDGPILQPDYKSFVGMNPIPIVHGMTLGELATMINGEYWLNDSLQCDLKIIEINNWNHSKRYILPVRPSPNLPNEASILQYPSLCLFEGTIVSIGRGTDYPFQCYGHPEFKSFETSFTPKPIKGVAPHPKLEGKECKGYFPTVSNDKIELEWLIGAYTELYKNSKFFNSFFSKLAGTNQLQKQIEDGWSAEEIRASWQPALIEFKKTRSKYLLYKDFE